MSAMIPGEMSGRRTATSSSTRAGSTAHAEGRQHRRPADPGRLALPLLRDQRGAALRPRAGARLPPQHRRRHRGALRAGPDAHRRAGRAWRAPRSSTASRGAVMGERCEGNEDHPAGLRRDVRPDRRRPRAARRHRAVIEVERDLTIYGEEVKFGGGKVIRDGMGQSQRAVDGRRRHRHHQRADRRPLGHRQGRHRHQGRPHREIGKAGNPDIQPGVDHRDRRRAPRSSPARA